MIHVATIIGAHGIKGEVKLRSFTSDPKAFVSYGPLTATDGRMFEVTKFRAKLQRNCDPLCSSVHR